MNVSVEDRTGLINLLISSRNYRSYLEIGVQYGVNYDHIVCDRKEAVDPCFPCTHCMTSDAFFDGSPEGTRFDLIFVDGLHEAEQAKRDICNSLRFLSDSGVVVVHDCSPESEQCQLVPRPDNQNEWTGDTWKAFVQFKFENPSVTSYVVDVDYGCGVIENPAAGFVGRVFTPSTELTWGNLTANKVKWLGLVSARQFSENMCVDS